MRYEVRKKLSETVNADSPKDSAAEWVWIISSMLT